MPEEIRVGETTFTKPNDHQLVATRSFDAPRELVWAAHTDCRHLQNWQLGPEGWTMPSCDLDLRPGGKYRFVYSGPDEQGFQFTGEFREVRPPEFAVQTEMMDDNPLVTVNTMTITEEDGRSVVRTVVDYPSKEVREQILATGMMDGWAKSYDTLDEYLRTISREMRAA